MIPEGFVEYQRRAYCNDIECPIQMMLNQEERGSEKYEQIRVICRDHCLHTTHEFHAWLIEKGYLVIKPAG